MMSETPTTADTSASGSTMPAAQERESSFDVALCGQCTICQSYFPCEQLSVLQIQSDDEYQDTGRLICFECHRSMNHRVYQARELTRQEMIVSLRYWLLQRHLLPAPSLPD